MKKKRKAPGVAAAVAEDAGLKKCKISRYRLSPPRRLSPSPGAGQAASQVERGEPSRARRSVRRPESPLRAGLNRVSACTCALSYLDKL